MSEAANGTTLVFPCRRRDTRDTILWSDPGLVDVLLAKNARVLIPLERMGRDGGDVDIAAKVSRQITKVGALLDDRATTVGVCLGMKPRTRQGQYLLDLSHQSGLAIASYAHA